MDCINSHSEKRGLGMHLDTYEGQPQICKQSNYFFFNIFGPFFTYAGFKLKISPFIASNVYISVL
jgi:hypothetical protein